MKDKLPSTFYKWFAFGLGIVSVLAMFLPFMNDEFLATRDATAFFWDVGTVKGAWPAFVGFMLILVGAIAIGVFATPFINVSEKVEKIVLISSVAAMFVGIILVIFLQGMYSGFNGGRIGMTLSDFTYQAGFYISVTAGLGATAMGGIAIAKDW